MNEVQPHDSFQANESLLQTQSQHSKKSQRNYDKKVHGKRMPLTSKIAVMAMKESGMTATDVAKATKVHVSTIIRAWDNPELEDLSPSIVQKTKRGLGGLFYKRALESTLAINSEKLEQASALQLATVAGIMTEKGRLMEGLSTDNVSFRGISQSIEEDRAKLMSRVNEIIGDKT